MEIREITLLLSNLLVILAYSLYILSILNGRSKPHRTTRLVLLIITGIAALSLLAQENRTAIWLASISAMMSSIVFLLTIKYGMGGWGKVDIISLIIALIGIIVWKLTNNPALGLFSAILADFSGVVPTLIKTYKYPKTEAWPFFAIGGAGSLLNLLSVRTWTIEEISYPLYIFLISYIIVLLIFRKRFLHLLSFANKRNEKR